jgi:YD repeat-containing protein
MQVTYDPKTDTLSVEFKTTRIVESDEEKPGMILDYDAQGDLVGIEILDASRHVADVEQVQFRRTE